MPPRISVIIPAYNAERYMVEALQSIFDQSLKADEIIVIDDGSTDQTAAKVGAFDPQIRCTRWENAGAAAARNQGIRLAKGDYLAFLDADDLWLPHKIAAQIDYLMQNPAVMMVFGQIEHFWSPDLPAEDRHKLHCPNEPQPGYLPTTLLCRREAFEQVGLFESQWRAGEFIDWYDRAMQLGAQAAVLPTVLARRRIHARNATRQRQQTNHDYLHVLHASLKRRRQAEGDDA
jgi:glycosyltransferase involved in cell wall biosynthesis